MASHTSSSSYTAGGLKEAIKSLRELNPKLFLKMAIRSLILTCIWIPVYICRCVVVAVVKKYYKSSYGKILDPLDSKDISLVFTLVLDDTIGLDELRELFRKNVLHAKISNKTTGEDELRYPELKQYKTDFAGYTFWRNDDGFNIAHHISEQPFSGNFASMARLHQEMVNQKFPLRKSPWEIILVRNYKNDSSKALIILRCSHSLGDTLSWIQLLVEGLGQKKLKLPNVQYSHSCFLNKILYYALLPFYFVYVQLATKLMTEKCDKSDWIQDWNRDRNSKLNISISNKIPLSDIKTVASRNGVTTSAVIMAAVVGGVAKSDERLAKWAMPVRWVLPKANHPDTLANHLHSRVMELPTNISSPLDRLHKCHGIISELKSSSLHEYAETATFQHGTWFSPFQFTFSIPTNSPLVISNIASDSEGFKVGSGSVSEFTMSSGTNRAIICTFSYKDWMEVTATIKDSILSERQTHELSETIEKEFYVLKKANKY